MFNKLFKPNWQHAKPAVRLKAIKQLEPNDESQQILVQLARRDSDDSVRCQAVQHLNDVSTLLNLLKTTSGDALTDAIHQRLTKLLNGNDDASPETKERYDIIKQIDDNALLRSIIDGAQQPDIALACLDRLDDEPACLQLALNGADRDIREAAALRIKQPTALRQLIKTARDKKVAQLARQRLKEHQQAEQQQAAIQQQLNELITQITTLAKQPINPLYDARLQHLQDQWQTLQTQADETQRSKAEQGLNQAQSQWQQHLAEQQEQAAAETQKTCLGSLDQLFSRLSKQGWLEQKDALFAQYLALVADWQIAVDRLPPSSTDKAHFAEIAARWEQLQQALATLEQINATDADSNENTDDRQQQLSALHAIWPANVAMPVTATVANQTAPKKSHKHDKPRHIGLLHGLRQSLRKRELKKANRIWARLEHELSEHPDNKSSKQAEPLKQQLDELRDWHAFAAKPKKDALCEKMDALAAAPLSHPEEQANAIQALHEAWHELMSSDQDADQTLWERFKTASDAAYEPCREHFQELDAEKAANKAKREALCAQLGEFLDQQDWETVDAAALWPIRRQADKDWKALSPVHYTDVRDINRQFRQQLKAFDRQLGQISERHEATLQQLIKRFEALAALDDSHAAVREAKQLQASWRDAGWVMPRRYRKLDKKKRQLGDQIFGKQRAERQQEKAQQQALADELKKALDALNTRLEATDDNNAAAIKAAVDDVERQQEPERATGLKKRKRQLLQQALQKRQQLAQRAKWDQWRSRIEQAPKGSDNERIKTLCVALEVINNVDSPNDCQAARRDWQLNNMAQMMKTQMDNTQRSVALLTEMAGHIDSGLEEQSRTRLLAIIQQLSNA